MDEDELVKTRRALHRSFSPGAPVKARDLFAGRIPQLEAVLDGIDSRGRHAIVYGERGVGKTSLANIVSAVAHGATTIVVKVNCDSDDDFASIWHKVCKQIGFDQERQTAGFKGESRPSRVSLEALLPDRPSPDDVQRVLQATGRQTVIILDELDRVQSAPTTRRLADTIKTLSDNSADSTLVLVGVADSVTDLIAEHLSIERALVQVQMPRMSVAELAEIVDRGLRQTGLTIADGARQQIVALSQGLPHYTHALSLYAGQAAIDEYRTEITDADVAAAIKQAVTGAQQSILQLHHRATSSPRRENLYGKVLLAAAMTPVDQLGYFAAADVREPMRKVTGKKYEIPSFSRHLHDLCDSKRGPVLHKTGAKRKLRFRFMNPLMQPFVLLNGIAQGIIRADLGHVPRLKAARTKGVSSQE